MTNLTSLSLSGTQVTDSGLSNLKGLTKLSRLSLGKTQVTDAGLVHLKGLTNLTWLDLEGTRVSDAGLAQLTVLQSSPVSIFTTLRSPTREVISRVESAAAP